MIMIAIGVIVILVATWVSATDHDWGILGMTLFLGGVVWFLVNTFLQFCFTESRLAYSAELEKIEGTSYYMIDDDSVPIVDYEVDRDDGRWATGDSSWDILYEDKNTVKIYEIDALWWLAVEMDFNPTYFEYTVADDDLILRIDR